MLTRFIHRICCFIGAHELPPHVEHATSLLWACRNCGALVPGGALKERR